MSLLSRMRDHNRKTAVRLHNQTRLSLSILAPVFISVGVLGHFGFGETRVMGEPVAGQERLLADLFFLVLGLLFAVARLTVFRHRRENRERVAA